MKDCLNGARRFCLCLLAALFVPLAVQADGDQVVVIYNSRVPASKVVADHYAAARHVPASQIYGFALTPDEIITRADFTDFLQKPLVEHLVANGLWKFGQVEVPGTTNFPAHTEEQVVETKIRYAVLCYGVPLKIAPSPIPAAPGTNPPMEKLLKPEFQHDEAAVDSELAWLPLIKLHIPLTGPLPNRFYDCTNEALLSPRNGILLVARLDGPTPEIANQLVDKALAAETNGLWGRGYFDIRNLQTNDAYYLGDLWLREAARICYQRGFDVELDTNAATFPEAYPMSHIAFYAGWYDGDVSGPFKQPGVEFMPGAFAYHLHSFSAETLRSTNTHWCGPLLAKGATCTMGCVYEPYLQFTPNIGLFLEAFCNGYTFGEAAWISQIAVSWQTTVIGDPLYQPFNKGPMAFHDSLVHAGNPLMEWSFEQLVNLDLARGAPRAQLEQFLENLPVTAKSAVLTEKLANIHDSLGKPNSAISAWQTALRLHPSPQQRIRIRRTLEEKLLALGRKADAIANDQELLLEAPDYPGKTQIENELKALQPHTATNSATSTNNN